jgi:hypothetical protein
MDQIANDTHGKVLAEDGSRLIYFFQRGWPDAWCRRESPIADLTVTAKEASMSDWRLLCRIRLQSVLPTCPP